MADPTLVDSIATEPTSTPEPDIYARLETAHGLPSGLLRAVETTESRGNPNAVSPTGVRGNMQITGATWRDYADPGEPFSTDPDRQREIAARILKDRIGRRGGVREGIAAYGDPNQADYPDLVYKNWTNPPQDEAPAPTEQPTIVALPDGTKINLGINPSPELREQVKAKIREKYPDLGAPTPAPSMQNQPGTVTTSTTTSDTPVAAPQTAAEMTPMDLGRSFNLASGRDPNSKIGMYTAEATLPIAQMIEGIHDAFTQPTEGVSGDPRELSTWMDGLSRAMKIMRAHPGAIVGEMAQNIVARAAEDIGAPGSVANTLGFIAALGVGGVTPTGVSGKAGPIGRQLQKLPVVGKAFTNATPVAEMPLQKTNGAAAAIKEAENLGSRESVAATLTPEGIPPAEASKAATKGLEAALDERLQPVKGIYNTAVENAQTSGRLVDPIIYNEGQLPQQIAAIEEDLGATMTGQTKKVIEAVKGNIERGEPIDPATMDAYKQQLDTLYPGRAPMSATPKQRLAYDFKWKVRDMLRSTFDDEERSWAEAADTVYRDEIIGKQNPRAIGRIVKLAQKDPETFAKRALGDGTSEQHGAMAEAVMKHLKDQPEKANAIREGVFGRWIDAATDKVSGEFDRGALLDRVRKLDSRFKDAVLTPEQDAFFKNLGKAHAAAEEGLKAGKQPGTLAWMTAKGIEIAGIEALAAAGVPRAISHGLGAAALLIPRDKIAAMIANSKNANLLARAFITGAKSPASIVLARKLHDIASSEEE